MAKSTSNGVDIWYEVSGDGPALVLVHANPFDHDLWLYQAAHFSTWFKVVTVDIRGYGRSAKITTPYTEKDMCDDVLGVLGDLGIERAVLGGCSVGSGIAIHLGLDHPETFSALILVGGNSGVSDRYTQRIEGYTKDLEAYHITHLKMLVADDFPDTRIGAYLLNLWVERQPRLKGDAIAQVFRAGNETDTTPRLGEMAMPVLVINGEFDHSLPAGKRTAELVPDGTHKVLPGTGHACCIEDPAGFDALMMDFLVSRGLLPPIA
ncbi:MAG: alpha/beta hydrolase [Alphaproteobacteria bacterium]|nr:alpha/beta hydrolase [Alphaproteobacteria bacterium]